MSRHLTPNNDVSTIRSLVGYSSLGNMVITDNPIGAFTITIDSLHTLFATSNLNIPNDWNSETDLIGIFIGSRVRTIGNNAFANMGSPNLIQNKLYLPDTLITIGDSAFAQCQFIVDDLVIPNSVTTIGEYAFKQTHLSANGSGQLTIPKGVTSILTGAFYGCTGFIGNLTIPDTIQQIKNSSFFGCTGFTGVLNIPSSISTIETSAFEHCEGITSIYIPDSVIVIDSNTFAYCTSVQKIYSAVDYWIWMGSDALLSCGNASSKLYVRSEYIANYTAGFQSFSGTIEEWTSYPNLMP